MPSAQSRVIDATLPVEYVLPSGDSVQRESGAWVDQRTGASLWIGSQKHGEIGWYTYDEESGTLRPLGPRFSNRDQAANDLIRHVEQIGMRNGMKAPLYSRDCLKYRGRCESFDVEDAVTKAIFVPGRGWAWLTIPVSLPVALAADLVWDSVKNVWLLSDTLLQTRARFGRYRLIWRMSGWMQHLLYRPDLARTLAHRHFEFLIDAFTKASESESDHGTEGRVP